MRNIARCGGYRVDRDTGEMHHVEHEQAA
jgi:hypothetical protein